KVADAEPHGGRRCLMLQVRPKPATGPNPPPPPEALEPTFVGVVSPTVKLPPGSLVRVTAWVKIPNPILASPDGVLFFDSIGGEPLAAPIGRPALGEQKTGWEKVPRLR